MKKLLISAILLVGAIIAEGATPPLAGALKFEACGNPNLQETICIASSANGNPYIVKKKANQVFYYFHLARLREEPTRLQYIREFTAPVVIAGTAGNYFEHTMNLVVSADSTTSRTFSAVLTVDGRTASPGYESFTMRVRMTK